MRKIFGAVLLLAAVSAMILNILLPLSTMASAMVWYFAVGIALTGVTTLTLPPGGFWWTITYESEPRLSTRAYPTGLSFGVSYEIDDPSLPGNRRNVISLFGRWVSTTISHLRKMLISQIGVVLLAVIGFGMLLGHYAADPVASAGTLLAATVFVGSAMWVLNKAFKLNSQDYIQPDRARATRL